MQLDTNKIQHVTRASIMMAVTKNKPAVLELLKSYSVQVPANISDYQLARVIYKGIGQSTSFRSSMATLMANQMTAMSKTANANGDSNDNTNPDGSINWAKTGLNLFNTGLGLLGSKIQSDTTAQSEKNALDYQVEKTKQLEAQNQINQTANKASWVLPVTVTVVLVGAIVGIYLVMKKKK